MILVTHSSLPTKLDTQWKPPCIQNEIHLSLSKGMPTALIFLDLLATFDTIDRDTLLTCLSTRFGFNGTVLRWFTTYLLDCFQSVKIGAVIFECFKLTFRVPHGPVLGLLFFSLYTSPLSQVIAKYMDVKYHFYCVNTSYPMDNSLSGRRRPARQTSEKDVLCFHRTGRSSAVHSPGGV